MTFYKIFTKRIFILFPDQFSAFSDLTENVIQPRHDDHSENRPEQHTAQCRCADRSVSYGTRPTGHYQRNQAGYECKRRHEDWPETHFGTFDRCLENGRTLVVFLYRKLNDQDRILSQQTYEHDQPHL